MKQLAVSVFVSDLPREPEIVDLFKKLAGVDPLPPR